MTKKIKLLIICLLIFVLVGFILPIVFRKLLYRYNKKLEKNNAIFVVNYGIENSSLLSKIKKLIK